MWLSTGKVAQCLGVAPCTIRRWDFEKCFIADYRTPGGHRRYKLTRIQQWLNFKKNPHKSDSKTGTRTSKNYTCNVVTYCRVSSSKQREDLKRQKKKLELLVAQRGWTLIQTKALKI